MSTDVKEELSNLKESTLEENPTESKSDIKVDQIKTEIELELNETKSERSVQDPPPDSSGLKAEDSICGTKPQNGNSTATRLRVENAEDIKSEDEEEIESHVVLLREKDLNAEDIKSEDEDVDEPRNVSAPVIREKVANAEDIKSEDEEELEPHVPVTRERVENAEDIKSEDEEMVEPHNVGTPVTRERVENAEDIKSEDEEIGEPHNGEAVDTREKIENAEDIRSEDEDEGSLMLDDFLDSLDVLDSWNPDEDELEGIDVDPISSQSSHKEDKSKGRHEKKEKDERRSRRYEEDKRKSGSSRRRSLHRERSLPRTDTLGVKSSRRSGHRDRSSERPQSRSSRRHGAEDLEETVASASPRESPLGRSEDRPSRGSAERSSRLHSKEDLRDVIVREADERRSKRSARERSKEARDSKEGHSDRPKDKEDKVEEVVKEKPESEIIKPPPGAKPVPCIKLPSDDLVPPGTEDEYWPKEDDTEAPVGADENGIPSGSKEGETVGKRRASAEPLEGAESSKSSGTRKTSSSRVRSERERDERDRDRRARSSELRHRNERFNEALRRERTSKVHVLRSRDVDRGRSRDRERLRLRSRSRSPRRRLSRERERLRPRLSPRLSPPTKRFRRSRTRSRSRDRGRTRSRSRDRSPERIRERRLGSDLRDRRSPYRSAERYPPSRSYRRTPVGDLREVLQRNASNRRSLERSGPSSYMYERFSSPSLSFELSPVSSGDRIRSLSRSPVRDLRPPTRRARRSYTPSSETSLSLSPEPYPDHLRPRKRIPFVKELERMFAGRVDGYPTTTKYHSGGEPGFQLRSPGYRNSGKYKFYKS